MNIVGHEDEREKLKSIIIQDKVGHAYLFYGKSGIGKKLVATEFAKNMMCLNSQNGVACGKCESCIQFGNNADFNIISPEKNIIKVDAIRAFEDEIYLRPTNSSRKCFIIDDSDLMNESSQNALLKVLEEPPLYATIILVSSSKERLIGTILSRVTEVDFKPLTHNNMKEILGIDFSDEIIKYSSGSVEKAMKLSNKDYINLALQIVNLMKGKSFLKLNKKFEEIKNDKDLKADISSVLEMTTIVCYHNIREDISFYENVIDIVNDANKSILRNGNIDLVLDNMITKICF